MTTRTPETVRLTGDPAVCSTALLEHRKAYKQKWARQNAEKMRAARKRWRDNNRPLAREIARRWARNNRSRSAANCRNWRDKNPDINAELNRRSARKRLESLSASYVRQQLRRGTSLSTRQIPESLVQLTIQIIKYKRLCRNLKICTS